MKLSDLRAILKVDSDGNILQPDGTPASVELVNGVNPLIKLDLSGKVFKNLASTTFNVIDFDANSDYLFQLFTLSGEKVENIDKTCFTITDDKITFNIPFISSVNGAYWLQINKITDNGLVFSTAYKISIEKADVTSDDAIVDDSFSTYSVSSENVSVS